MATQKGKVSGNEKEWREGHSAEVKHSSDRGDSRELMQVTTAHQKSASTPTQQQKEKVKAAHLYAQTQYYPPLLIPVAQPCPFHSIVSPF